jgi:hypothetical protein
MSQQLKAKKAQRKIIMFNQRYINYMKMSNIKKIKINKDKIQQEI